MSKVSDELLPCPLCGQRLIWAESSAQMGIREPFYEHPDTGDCVLRVLTFMDRPEQVAAWDRRAALEAVSSIHEAEPVVYGWVHSDDSQAFNRYGMGTIVQKPEPDVSLTKPLYAHPAPISKGVTGRMEWEQGEARSDGDLYSVHQLSQHVWQTRFNGTEICRWRGTEKEAREEAELHRAYRLSHTAGEP